MIEFLNNWKGAVEINGTTYNSVNDIPKSTVLCDSMCICLHSKNKVSADKEAKASDVATYKIEVKQYMTKPASPTFDFMAKWNNNIPMPLKIMVGEKIKETPGMLYMKLHADITEERTQCCMKCGRPIVNPISQFFGMGPECGQHNYTNPFNSQEELIEAVKNYRENFLKKITWEGWIIKSAITSAEIL